MQEGTDLRGPGGSWGWSGMSLGGGDQEVWGGEVWIGRSRAPCGELHGIP